jgi:DNA-binding transcriptional regulator YdaS (Cro superfamily)
VELVKHKPFKAQGKPGQVRVRVTSAHAFTPASARFRDFSRGLSGVTAVSPGKISRVSSGRRAVKVTEESGAIKLAIRGESSIQDVRVFVKKECWQEVKQSLAKYVVDSNYALKYGATPETNNKEPPCS